MSASPALAFLLGTILAAPASDPLDRVLNGPADYAAIFQAHGALRGCAQPTCQAVDHIAQAFEVATRRDLPNTMVHLHKSGGDPDREADRALRRLLPASGPLHPAYCPILIKMARHYAEYSVGLLVVEFANRVDGTSDRCTREVIAAFPSTKDAADMIAASRDSCQTAGRSGCQRDQHPPTAVFEGRRTG